MPILFNFHILLATFNTIFGTNILIYYPVPDPVSCMFYVSQKHHIKRSPNGIKTDGEYFWNIYDFWEEESTRDDARGGHETGAHGHSRWAHPHPRGPLVRWLMPFFGRKKANFWKTIWAKVSIQSKLLISRYKGNGARAESQNAETERDRDNIQFRRGSRPSHAMEAKDQRGNPSPI